MKICQNCGMEYGDNNSFCPFCDERYGTVILVDDVISADGLPLYKEEFPVVGEITVKQESFAVNRDEIFDRNTRLAEIENFMPKVEVKKVYKPVVPLVQVDSNGSIAPYVQSVPVVKNVPQNVKKIKKFNGVKKSVYALISIYVAYILLFLGARLFGDVVSEPVYHDWGDSWETYVYETYVYGNGIPVPKDITITSENGLEMKLTLEYKLENSKYYKYRFGIVNTTGKGFDNVYQEFSGLEYTDKFYFLIDDNDTREQIIWTDGIPDIAEGGRPISLNEFVSGEVWLDFSDD